MAALAAGSILLLCSAAWAAPVTGGTTTVNLNAGTVTALVGLGFSVAPIAPATDDLTATPPKAVFPITGGDDTTNINHSGGLALLSQLEGFALGKGCAFNKAIEKVWPTNATGRAERVPVGPGFWVAADRAE